MTTNCFKDKWKYNLPVKSPCGKCQSCIDSEKSYEITKKHKRGFPCKGSNKNQCRYCCFIRQMVKELRHKTNSCLKNCPYCKNNDGMRCSSTKNLIKMIYRWMF